MPTAAVTALQSLHHHGEIRVGQTVVVNGASGGVGTFAVQIAKSYGAEVTGVTSSRNVNLVRSLGADHTVGYTTTDFTRTGSRYGLLLDTIGNRSVADLSRALAEGGNAAVTGFTSMSRLLGVTLRGGKDVARVEAHVTTKDLELLSTLIEAGNVCPQIDWRYPFAEMPAAIAYLEQGRARGKWLWGWPEDLPGLRVPSPDPWSRFNPTATCQRPASASQRSASRLDAVTADVRPGESPRPRRAPLRTASVCGRGARQRRG